jgi:DNA polymerase elongation subunit (family B)
MNMSDSSQNDIKNILKKYIHYLSENPIKYPVSGLDYSSLYPSLIMAYNLSPEYLILDDDYKNQLQEKDYNIHNIKFEYNYENYLGEKHSKDIIGWTVRHNELNKENTMFGLYPTILRDLFKQRAEMKKELAIYKDKKEHIEKYERDYIDNLEYKECLFKLKYCDTKQKALKVFMNTFYGEMGNKNSPLFQLPLAGGVTSAGQYNLLLIKKYVEDLGHKVYYGDSVIGETPVLIRYNKKHIELMNIQDVCWGNSTNKIGESYSKYYIYKSNGKEYIRPNIFLKHNIEVYTENGWTKIKKVIRHKTNKKLYRITTINSIIVVTEDHSLLNDKKEKIKPEECSKETKLLTWNSINLSHLTFNLDYSLEYYLNRDYIYCYTQLKAQTFYLYFKQLGYNVLIDTLSELTHNCVYRLKVINERIFDGNIIQNIEFLGYSNDYVYDLETSSHHFAAGIGNLVVHNTDSLYISCPDSYYLDLDKDYYSNKIDKEEYNTKLVITTFKAIEDIKVKVNEYLYQNNGTKYLKMSYEEVLYPLAFLSKKKYFGIPHETLPNFKPKDLFIRGLEVKKRGVSELLKIICMDLMWKSMDLNNTKTLRELVNDKIKEIFTKKWGLEDFIQTGVWKPEKKNITLNNFVERMKQENKLIPTPGERFSYVIIKRYPYKYDYKGRQIPLLKADKMEYLDVVKQYNYDIDLKYYFDNQINGQFARLISYDSEFEIQIIDVETNQYVIDDDKTLNQCKKYITQLVDQFNNTYTDRKDIFKNLYKEVNKQYKLKKNEVYNKKFNILLDTQCKSDESNIYKMINDNIKYYLQKFDDLEHYANLVIKAKYSDSDRLNLIYNKQNKSYYIKQQEYLQNTFNKQLDNLLNMINQHNLQDKIFNIDNANIINIITHIKNQKKLDDICDSEEVSKDIDLNDLVDESEININLENKDLYLHVDPLILNEIHDNYIKLIATKKNKLIHEIIYNKIYDKKFTNSSYIPKPKDFEKFKF